MSASHNHNNCMVIVACSKFMPSLCGKFGDKLAGHVAFTSQQKQLIVFALLILVLNNITFPVFTVLQEIESKEQRNIFKFVSSATFVVVKSTISINLTYLSCI